MRGVAHEVDIRYLSLPQGWKCRKEILENVMPLWMKHGWDREHGVVYTCLDRGMRGSEKS